MPPLNFGRILAIFDMFGNTPDSEERFISGVNSSELESGLAAAFSILAGISSAPVALDGFVVLSAVKTSFTVSFLKLK